MELKTGYKQTNVGIIPDDWYVRSLGSIGSVIRGASPRPKGDKRFYAGDIPRLMVEDVTRDKKFVTPQIDFLTKEGAKYSRPCRQGTLTIVCSGTPGVVGLPSFLAVDACIHDGMMALVNIRLGVVPDYLFHQLTSYQEKLYLAATHGGTFVNLTTTGFRVFELALPPTKTEQQAIAAVLSDVDALLGGLDQFIAKKRDVKQAAMQQLLTGQKRLPGFHEEWKERCFGELTVPRTERHKPRIPDAIDCCVELEHIQPITGKLLRWTSSAENSSSKTAFRTGDILFGKLRAYLRKFWLATRAGVCSTEIWVFGPNFRLVTSEYLFQLVRVDRFIETASAAYGTHMPRSDWNVVKNYKVRLPPIPEQAAIAEVLTDMDAEIAQLEQRREKTRALKQGIMQELLTGKTRLI